MFPDIKKLTEDEQYTLSTVANLYIPNALRIIKDKTGFSFNRKLKVGIIKGTDSKVKIYDTPFIFVTLNKDDISPYSLDDDTLISTGYHTDSDTAVIDTVNLTVNKKYFSKIRTDITEGISYDYPDVAPLSKLVLQELSKAALAVNLKGNRYPLWFTEGFAAALCNDNLFKKVITVLSDIKRTEAALDPDVQTFESFVKKTDPAVAGFTLLHYMKKQF